MRRRLCQVNADHGDPAKRDWKECCRVCLEGTKGPPAEVAVTGARDNSRRAHAEDHVLVGVWIQDLEPFSSKKERVLSEMSEGRMLADSPTRNRCTKARQARHKVRESVVEWARSARKRKRSGVAQSCGGGGAEMELSERARAQWNGVTVEGKMARVSNCRTAAMSPRAAAEERLRVTME